jgi:hypothetical protein
MKPSPLCAALLAALCAPVHADMSAPTPGDTAAAMSAARYEPPLARQPMNRIVADNAYRQLDWFFERLAQQGLDTTIDGQAAFKSGDKFLPGKVAAGLGHVLLNTPKDDPRLPQLLAQYRRIADLTVEMDNHTWGIYYYVGMLYQLQRAGLLERALTPATLAKLREKLDWRSFVSTPDYGLINLPTNYYGVAFSIARLRMLLGWEDEQAGTILLDRMLKHYATFSGKFGFSDETNGEGRFDRYSILLIAEICERYVETGLPVTADLKALLRKAADVALSQMNTTGSGFTFGRSLGPYGETALVEILSISAYLGVLSAEEKEYAYAFSSRVAARYMDFWYDPAMHSLDMWGKGRRTDTYRGKHRILGENFSLLHQLISTNELWNGAGMRDRVPRADLQAWLDKTRPPFTLTRFAQGDYDRALAVYRDRRHVFSLLMVNGGASQYDNSPYYPLPFAPGIIAGVADSGPAHPQLLPKFTLDDGTELLGTSYLKDIAEQRAGGRHVVRYRQDELAKQGGKGPVKDARLRLATTYVFEPGLVTRTDVYTPQGALPVRRVSLEFASFSARPKVEGNIIRFGEGDVTEYRVDGLQDCRAEPTAGNDAFKAPYGPMQTLVSCALGPFTMQQPLTIRWSIRYRQ